AAALFFEKEGLSLFSFAFEQLALDVEPVGVATERAVRPDNAVARNQHRDMVGAVGRAGRAHRARVAGRGGDLGVGASLAWRDPTQFLPHSPLDRGAALVDWYVGPACRVVDCGDHALQEALEFRPVLDELGVGE